MAHNWGRPDQNRFYSGRHESPVTYDLYWRARHNKEKKFMDQLISKMNPVMGSSQLKGARNPLGGGSLRAPRGANAERDFVRGLKAGSRQEEVRRTWPALGMQAGSNSSMDKLPLGAIKAAPNSTSKVSSRGRVSARGNSSLAGNGTHRKHLGAAATLLRSQSQMARQGNGGSDSEDEDEEREISRLKAEVTRMKQEYEEARRQKAARKEKKRREKALLLDQLSDLQTKLDTVRSSRG